MIGKVYVEIGRFFPSSKTCNQCLFKVSDMNLTIREWKCPQCEAVNDRDINAAKNIRDEGLRFMRLDVRMFPTHTSETRQALGISAAASGRNVSQPGRISVLSDAVAVEAGSPLSTAR
jgi:putative transposase